MGRTDEGKALRKIWLWLAGLTAAGAAGFLFKGGHASISFVGGAAIASLSFRMLEKATGDVTRAALGEPLRAPSALRHMVRFGLVFGLTYVMLKVYGVDQTAFVCGLLTPVTAAFLEALIESFYA